MKSKKSNATKIILDTLILSAEEMLCGAKQKTFWLENKIAPDDIKLIVRIASKITVTKISYQSNSHAVVGYIIEPRNATGKLPCIIMNRGGYLNFSKWNQFTLISRLGLLAAAGYIVIASQYSGVVGGDGKDEYGGEDISDVLTLKDVLERHSLADIKNIGMMGESRGGMMTYLALARVPWVKAAVVIGGLTDLARNQNLRPEMKQVFKESFGGKKTELEKRSALRWSKKLSKDTPLLIMHGAADTRVTPLDSLDMSALLVANNHPHRLVIFENGDHLLLSARKERDALVFDWFEKYLK